MGKAAVTFVAGLLLALGTLGVGAQQPQAPAPTESSTKSARPLWSELSPKQQAVLAPLAAEWENLDTTRRKKWVTIANRYPKMTADEQRRLKSRMQDWASLTPAQRRVARENYQQLKELPRAQRGEIKQKWQQSQEAAKPAQETGAAPDAPGK